jgi:hypothetical protein
LTKGLVAKTPLPLLASTACFRPALGRGWELTIIHAAARARGCQGLELGKMAAHYDAGGDKCSEEEKWLLAIRANRVGSGGQREGPAPGTRG